MRLQKGGQRPWGLNTGREHEFSAIHRPYAMVQPASQVVGAEGEAVLKPASRPSRGWRPTNGGRPNSLCDDHVSHPVRLRPATPSTVARDRQRGSQFALPLQYTRLGSVKGLSSIDSGEKHLPSEDVGGIRRPMCPAAATPGVHVRLILPAPPGYVIKPRSLEMPRGGERCFIALRRRSR